MSDNLRLDLKIKKFPPLVSWVSKNDVPRLRKKFPSFHSCIVWSHIYPHIFSLIHSAPCPHSHISLKFKRWFLAPQGRSAWNKEKERMGDQIMIKYCSNFYEKISSGGKKCHKLLLTLASSYELNATHKRT